VYDNESPIANNSAKNRKNENRKLNGFRGVKAVTEKLYAM
jgi:hypothetical protein